MKRRHAWQRAAPAWRRVPPWQQKSRAASLHLNGALEFGIAGSLLLHWLRCCTLRCSTRGEMTASASAVPCQTPQQFVMSTARGAYTTVLVKEGSKLINWPKHVERLQRSLQAMHEAISGMYGAYYDCLKVRGCLRDCPPRQVPNSSQRRHNAGDTRPRACSVATATWTTHSCGAPGSQAGQRSCARLHADGCAGAVSCAAVRPGGVHLCPPPWRPALQQSRRISSDPWGTTERADRQSEPLRSASSNQSCHCSPHLCGARSALTAPRLALQDSGWVAERQPLEQQKGDAAEVLLCTRGGQVLEGLVTNLFVVAGTAAAPEVWTAGMQDGVVWGTVRAQVLQACHQLGIPVREEAPDMARRHEWREAFLTNGLRVVQPLSSIACGKGNVFGHPAWELAFPAAPGPVTSAITAALTPLLPAVDAVDL